jgi:dTMP kinase
MNTGKIIVFEGINGSGKTTIINNIYKELLKTQKNVKILKFPNRNTESGIIIDKFLKKQYNFKNLDEQIKIFADNRKECKESIEILLKNNYIILCDRYIYSNIAYILTDQTLNILNNNNKNDKIISFSNIIQYDYELFKPHYVFLIKGDYIHLRNNTIIERYHADAIKNNLIFNNYILSLKYTNANFIIINNNIDNLHINIKNMINIINTINGNKITYF